MSGFALRRLLAESVAVRSTLVLAVAYANAAGVSWPFSFGFVTGAPLWWLQILAMTFFLAVLRKSFVKGSLTVVFEDFFIYDRSRLH